ncbi:PREDICTED: coiled-coil domain-containing protein 93-like [Priapulus caudatus]|uniref:Coiled-coil domain-containing protein 93 n=1 Tax=Priapulus caudatus TaxID=37621 RepID=A0ABM1E9V6_PRICU|nr:PREDICTED: coiled-coil domain-containing protein 93-like [Priapulus caudatus]
MTLFKERSAIDRHSAPAGGPDKLRRSVCAGEVRTQATVATPAAAIDAPEVPTRAEVSQYQRRFVELYNQVGSKHTETKQFYTLDNTLDDTRLYLDKEANLLNSIHDNFEQAMASPSTREQFLKQFEQIVEGVKQNRTKVEKKKQEAKMKSAVR